MPRPPRIEFPGAFYHVFSRGNRREIIFRNEGDYAYFEACLLEKIRLCSVRLYAWCLMPNHFHLLIETPLGNVSIFMRRLLTQYARFFNKKYQLVGHVFQGRYKAHVCEHDAYFLTLIRYIHLNPVHVKGSQLVQTLEDWRWSSHRFYNNGKGPAAVQNVIDTVLDRFQKSRPAALVAYRKYIRAGLHIDSSGAFDDFNGPMILGSEEFIDKVKEKTNSMGCPPIQYLKPIQTVEELVDAVTKAFQISQEKLFSPNMAHGTSRIRQAFAYVGRYIYRLPTISLAKALGRGGPAISLMIQRLENRGGTTVELEHLKAFLRINPRKL